MWGKFNKRLSPVACVNNIGAAVFLLHVWISSSHFEVLYCLRVQCAGWSIS